MIFKNNNGLSFSLFGSIDKIKQTTGNFKDVKKALSWFNFEKSIGSTDAQALLNKNIKNTTSSLQDYLKSLNGAKASLGGYTKYLINTNVKTKALELGTKALKFAIDTVAMIGISWAISSVTNAIQEYQANLEKARQETIEAGKVADETNDKLQEYIVTYHELAKTGGSADQLKDLQQQIADLVGAQADNLDLVNGKLDDELEKLRQISIEQAQKNKGDLTGALVSAEQDLEDAKGSGAYSGYSHRFFKIDDSLLSDSGFMSLLDSLGVAQRYSNTGEFTGSFTFAQDSAENLYKSYQACVQAVTYMKDNMEPELLKESALYNDLTAQIGKYSEAAKAYGDALNAYNQNEAIIAVGENLKTFTGEINDQTSFDNWVEGIINAEGATGDYADAIWEVCGSRYPQFARESDKVANELNKVEEAAKGANSTVKSFKNIANEIDTAIDAITNAQTDMSENGYLTVDSIIALEEAGLTDYLKETENGYVLANGALETYLDSQGKTYQNAVTDAVKNASKLATQQEAVAAGYENSAKGLLLYLKAQKASAISQIPNDEMRMFNYKKIIEQYDPAINSIETAIKNQEKFDKVIKTKKKENKDKKSNDGSKTNKTAENKIAYYKHQHEMGIISEAAYYKKLEKIRKDYYAGKKDYLKRDRELQEEYHDWEVDKAKETFETKSESLIQNFIDQKDPKKKRKNNKKGYTFAEFKSDYNKLIKDIEKVDKDAAKELRDNRDEVFKDAKESFVNQEIDDLKTKLDFGEITNDEYIKRLNNIGTKLKKLGIDIKDFPDIQADVKLTVHEDEVDKAKETFETKSEALISDYVAGKFNYAEFKKRYKALIADVKKVDKEEAAQLTEEAPEVYKDAREQRFDASYDKLKYQLENGFITEKKYYKDLDTLYKNYYGDKTKYLDEYAQYSQEVYDGFKEMYKKDYEAQKESLEKQKEEITEYYDDLIEKKREEHDAEDYEKEQSEKRKEIFDLDMQIAELMRDGSEKAKARIAELEEERLQAEEDLLDFETDKAREDEIERLEKEKTDAIKGIQDQIDNIDKSLEDLNTNTKDIRNAVIQYAKAKGVDIKFAYASGTRSSVGGFGRINEKGIEMIASPDGNGNYVNLMPGSYVFSAKATEFLWKLATEHSLPQAMYNSIAKSIKTQSSTPSVNIAQPITITMGDIIIKGNADKQTVADIKREQENTVRMVLQKIKELQK